MSEEKDYVDITPADIGGKAKKGAVFQETELMQISENPSGLTREGIDEKIALWKKSSNSQVVIKYETMKARCKNIKPSGKTADGKIILAYATDGTPSWVKEDPNFVPKKTK